MPSFFRTEGPSATLAGLSCESSQGSPYFNALRQRFLLDAGQIIHSFHATQMTLPSVKRTK